MAGVMLILALVLLKPNQPQIRFTNFFIGDVKPINLIRIVNVFNINIRIVESQLQNCFIKNFLDDVKYLSFDKNYEQNICYNFKLFSFKRQIRYLAVILFV